MPLPAWRQWQTERHLTRPGYRVTASLVVTWDARRGLDCLRSDTLYHPDGRFSGPIVSWAVSWRGARRCLLDHDRRLLRAIEAFLAEATPSPSPEVLPCSPTP